MMTDPASAIKCEVLHLVEPQIETLRRDGQLTDSDLEGYRARSGEIPGGFGVNENPSRMAPTLLRTSNPVSLSTSANARPPLAGDIINRKLAFSSTHSSAPSSSKS